MAVDPTTGLVSPGQAARAIGVSESSLKRWCDQGLIAAVRTAGGHRKMAVSEVLRFLREQGQTLECPEVLGLPPVGDQAALSLARARPRLVEALLAGEELVARQIVLNLYLGKHALSVIFDEVVAFAFHDVGDRWACQAADVYQERRGCEIMLRILFEIRRVLPVPNGRFVAIGGTIEGDEYALPTAMAELVLREAGFCATSLGTGLPFSSLISAVRETRPRLFWLSVSHIRGGLDFPAQFATLSAACADAGTALVVGGRALVDSLRLRMTYSAFCDTMQHLEAFAETLFRSLERDRKAKAPRKSSLRRGKTKEPQR